MYKNFKDIVAGEELIDSEDIGYSMNFQYIFVREKREKSFIFDSVTIDNRSVRITWNEYETRYKDDQWLERELKIPARDKSFVYRDQSPDDIRRSFSIERKKIQVITEQYKRLAFQHLFSKNKEVYEQDGRERKIPLEQAEKHVND